MLKSLLPVLVALSQMAAYGTPDASAPAEAEPEVLAEPAPIEEKQVPPFPNTLRGASGINSYLLWLVENQSYDSPFTVSADQVGSSLRGTPILMFTITDRQSEPRKGGLLVVARQHGDEPAGTRAAVELLRRMTIEPTDDTPVSLGGITLRIIPIANPDGVDMFQRRTANNKDMNRDWIALRLPETRAIAGVIAATQPDVVLDLHEMRPQVGGNYFMIGYPRKAVAGVLWAAKQALRERGLPARALAWERSNTRTLLHRNFAYRYGRPGILVESKYYGEPTGDLERRSEYHITVVLAAVEELGRVRVAKRQNSQSAVAREPQSPP